MVVRDAFAHEKGLRDKKDNGSKSIAVPTAFKYRAPKSIRPRRWVYDHHLLRGAASALFADGGRGKSTLELGIALACASGKPVLGVKPVKRIKVYYWNGEEPREELDRRVAAAMQEYGLTAEDLDGWFFYDSGKEPGHAMCVAEVTSEGLKINKPLMESLKAHIEKLGIGVLIVDPFITVHRVGENDNTLIRAVADEWSALAAQADIAVELVHHMRKHGTGEATVDDGRGASSLKDATRSNWALNPMTTGQAKQAAIPQNEKGSYFYVDPALGKENYSQWHVSGLKWFKLVSVALGNAQDGYDGDNVGVATHWEPADVTLSLDSEAIRQAQAEVGLELVWRESSQAGMWVGKAIAKPLGFNYETDKAKIKGIVAGWITEGYLEDRQVNG